MRNKLPLDQKSETEGPSAAIRRRFWTGFNEDGINMPDPMFSIVETALEVPSLGLRDENMLVVLASKPVPDGWQSLSVFDAGKLSVRVISRSNNLPSQPAFARFASTNQTRHIHSGHSLTDSYINQPWHYSIYEAIFGSGSFVHNLSHAKSTVPGSSTKSRWLHNWEDPVWGHGLNPRDDMGQYDSLIITEAGEVVRPDPDAGAPLLENIFYEMLFAITAWQQGSKAERPTEYIFWCIWPATSSENWQDTLVDYERRFKWRADYITWKMHQLFPELPDGWRVWIIPGHRLIHRISLDINVGVAPGYTSIEQMFTDDIHPAGSLSYACSALVMTMLHQIDLRGVKSTYDPTRTEAPSLEQAEYFQNIAWEICTAYEPAGMGGTEGAETVWAVGRDNDIYPNYATPRAFLEGNYLTGAF